MDHVSHGKEAALGACFWRVKRSCVMYVQYLGTCTVPIHYLDLHTALYVLVEFTPAKYYTCVGILSGEIFASVMFSGCLVGT